MSLDIIISTATAHHLPFDWLLEFAKEKLRPDDKLILLDLVKANSITDYIVWGFATLPNIMMNLIKNGKLHKDDPHATDVWRRHGEHDHLSKASCLITFGLSLQQDFDWIVNLPKAIM